MGAVNNISRGAVYAGDYLTADGQMVHAIVGQIARTNTAAKTLGHIPAGATIIDVAYIGATASDAGTTAKLDVGFSDGTGKELVNDADVKGTGTGVVAGVLSQLIGTALAAAHTITGKYAETGTASTTGGPWGIRILFVTNVTPKFA